MKTFISFIHFHKFERLVNNFYNFHGFCDTSQKNIPSDLTLASHPILDPPLPPGPEPNLAVGNLDKRERLNKSTGVNELSK